MEWMLMPLKRYAQFTGRSRRMEYWMYTLLIVIASVVCWGLDNMLGLTGILGNSASTPATAQMGALRLILLLGTFIPSLAVSTRRLHDTNRSGWWLLIFLVPYAIGVALMAAGAGTAQLGLLAIAGIFSLGSMILAIVLLVFMCLPGTSGANDYGPDPLDPSGAELGEVFN